MAKPPVQPLIINGRPLSYFQHLASLAKDYLQVDGVSLNFTGYNETIVDYANLQESDLPNAWKLTKELNAWSEYFSGLANLIQKMYLDSETDKIEVIAISSLEADSVKVANGERLANKDLRVVNARKKRNTLKSFHDELESKIKFLERAHYHCKSTCDWANKQNNVLQAKE